MERIYLMKKELHEIVTIFPESWKYSNTYFLDIAGGIIVDPGMPRKEGFDAAVAKVFATHGHYDHLMGIDSWLNTNNTFYFPEQDVWMLEDQEANASKMFANARNFPKPHVELKDGDVIHLDDVYSFKVFNTPGHTQGSSCFLLVEKEAEKESPLAFFSGDTVFDNSIGRSDLSGGDPQTMQKTVKRVQELFYKLPQELVVFTGHGRATTIEKIFRFNPFFRRGGLRI